MKPSRLAALRDKALKETDFSRFWSYFLDHFDPDEFLAAARPIEDSVLPQIVASVWHECSGKSVATHRLTLVEIPGTGIVHGSGWLDSSLALLVYFENPGFGMLAVTEPGGEGTKFARFVAVGIRPAGPKSGRANGREA